MKELRYTLSSEGSSDQALLPILSWLLRQHTVEYAIQAQWADLRRLPRPPHGLPEKIELSLKLYPCNLVFIHRDADRLPHSDRVAEIRDTINQLDSLDLPPVVCVVPVRMQEAWLLFNETALRHAVGNPNGNQRLEMPPIKRLETLPNPKDVLYELLREASGLRGRRRRNFPVNTVARRVAEFIDNFSPLRALPAFNALEDEIRGTIKDQGWSIPDIE
jgi:hypothetical protein